MSIALCPGSFDPITNGHLDVIRRAAGIFDKVLVTVFHNPRKTPLFTIPERMQMAREATADIPNVEVDSCDGLLVEYARSRGVNVIVKGLRAVSDFETEFQMAQMNRELEPSIETMFIMTKTENLFLSSRIIKEIVFLGGDVSRFVPPVVNTMLQKKKEGS
ncbi:MAG TPA: pantetheine-phosphate adenylyltransferase [Sphingobacteriaceae bacterium]|nr:pantetheine-phosphate adenylyltransferase [Sphingobacteriaceae bacterium]